MIQTQDAGQDHLGLFLGIFDQVQLSQADVASTAVLSVQGLAEVGHNGLVPTPGARAVRIHVTEFPHGYLTGLFAQVAKQTLPGAVIRAAIQ